MAKRINPPQPTHTHIPQIYTLCTNLCAVTVLYTQRRSQPLQSRQVYIIIFSNYSQHKRAHTLILTRHILRKDKPLFTRNIVFISYIHFHVMLAAYVLRMIVFGILATNMIVYSLNENQVG